MSLLKLLGPPDQKSGVRQQDLGRAPKYKAKNKRESLILRAMDVQDFLESQGTFKIIPTIQGMSLAFIERYEKLMPKKKSEG